MSTPIHSSGKKTLLWIGAAPVVAVVFYIVSAFLVLDWTEAAYPHDEENLGARQVAFGPRPRPFLCRAAYSGGYDGEEWALVFYRPLCQIWIAQHGYAQPARWR